MCRSTDRLPQTSDGTIVSYEWDLDNDGQYDDATGATPTYNAGSSGTFTIGLQVTDDRGGTDVDTALVTVANVGPTAEAGGPYSGDEGSNIQLTASGSTDPGNDIVAYDWDLDNDGSFDDASGVTIVFNSTDDDVFAVGLRVTDDDGATSTDTSQVTVNNVAPTADAGGPYDTDEGVNVTLTAAGSTDPGNDIVSYEWDLDNDGQYDDGTEVTATFNSNIAGPHTVGVKVTDDDGAWSTDTATVTVGASETEVFADSFENGRMGRQMGRRQPERLVPRSTQRETDGNVFGRSGRAGDQRHADDGPQRSTLDLSGYGSTPHSLFPG